MLTFYLRTPHRITHMTFFRRQRDNAAKVLLLVPWTAFHTYNKKDRSTSCRITTYIVPWYNLRTMWRRWSVTMLSPLVIVKSLSEYPGEQIDWPIHGRPWPPLSIRGSQRCSRKFALATRMVTPTAESTPFAVMMCAGVCSRACMIDTPRISAWCFLIAIIMCAPW